MARYGYAPLHSLNTISSRVLDYHCAFDLFHPPFGQIFSAFTKKTIYLYFSSIK